MPFNLIDRLRLSVDVLVTINTLSIMGLALGLLGYKNDVLLIFIVMMNVINGTQSLISLVKNAKNNTERTTNQT